jgi:hypothetical protein
MACHHLTRGNRFRVWIVAYEGTAPTDWRNVPRGAIAVAPAERCTMSARRAGVYVEAFNRAAVAGPAKRWAVALPVNVRYEGEPESGQPIKAGA